MRYGGTGDGTYGGAGRVIASPTFTGTAAVAVGGLSHYYNVGAEGATNYERAALLWSSNQFVISTEAGGTGTIRDLRLFAGSGAALRLATGGADRWVIDSSGNFRTSTAGVGLGYTTGAGGAQTQLTSKATGVTLSTATGQITMNNASLAAGTIVSFVLTNTAIAATDILVLNHVSGGTPGSYTLNAQCAAGSATINVRNNTAGALAEAIVIGFVLIKGATA